MVWPVLHDLIQIFCRLILCTLMVTKENSARPNGEAILFLCPKQPIPESCVKPVIADQLRMMDMVKLGLDYAPSQNSVSNRDPRIHMVLMPTAKGLVQPTKEEIEKLLEIAPHYGIEIQVAGG